MGAIATQIPNCSVTSFEPGLGNLQDHGFIQKPEAYSPRLGLEDPSWSPSQTGLDLETDCGTVCQSRLEQQDRGPSYPETPRMLFIDHSSL